MINNFKLNKKDQKFPGIQEVENLCFFIGLHNKNIKKETLNRLVYILFKIDTV